MSRYFRPSAHSKHSSDKETHANNDERPEKLEHGWVDITPETSSTCCLLKEDEGTGFEDTKTYAIPESIKGMLSALDLHALIPRITQRPEDHLSKPEPYRINDGIQSLLLSHDSHTLIRYLRLGQHPVFHFHFVRSLESSLMKIDIAREGADLTVLASIHAQGQDFDHPLTSDGQAIKHLLPEYMTKPISHEEEDDFDGYFTYKWDVSLTAVLHNHGDRRAELKSYSESYIRPADAGPNTVDVHCDQGRQHRRLARRLASNLARFFFLVATKACYRLEQGEGECFVATT